MIKNIFVSDILLKIRIALPRKLHMIIKQKKL